MKIAVLTSGGDSAGMNAAVRAVVKAGILRGCDTWIVREGYEGLVLGNSGDNSSNRDADPVDLPPPSSLIPENKGNTSKSEMAAISNAPIVQHLRFGDGELLHSGQGDAQVHDASGRTLKGRYIIRVGWDDVRGWLGEGGTVIGTARSLTFRTPEGRLKAANNLIKEGIEALVVCGGDGSLTGADKLRGEWPSLVAELLKQQLITPAQASKHSHLRIVGLVGSIDNDMALTDQTIGASTALHRICESIDNINTTASSHSRAFVIEVMGRHCGWLALLSGVAAGADFIFIPEEPADAEKWEDEMCACITRHRKIGKRKTIVIIAEGAIDTRLNPIHAEHVKTVLHDRLGLDTRVTTLGHTQRGGRPCAYDRILATRQGTEAVDALLEAKTDTPSYMIGISENQITRVPLVEAVKQTQAVAQAIEAKEFKKAIAMRDPEFAETLQNFYTSSTLSDKVLSDSKGLQIAIMHVGAPAGGMNAATRTAVRYCVNAGHTPLAVHNGFQGLLDDHIVPLSWLEVDNWSTRGGSELGTNRILPDVDLGAVASRLQEHKIDGLLLIGGFEAFSSLLILEKGREMYPSLNIPMVHLPATISNNVPVTEFSLGTDTSLNALIDACDAIKQSASASRNRVFVVETQGGQCGYIATMGALATGAVICYTPETGISLKGLLSDIEHLKIRYRLDVPGNSEGRLVLRNEKASNVYTTELLTKILKEESEGLFDSRSASLGHTLQGGIPSPIDRARADRLAAKCMAFIETHANALRPRSRSQSQSQGQSQSQSQKQSQGGQGRSTPRRAPPESAAMIVVEGTAVKFVPIRDVVQFADMKNRRAKHSWWEPYKTLAEQLGGLPQLDQTHERAA